MASFSCVDSSCRQILNTQLRVIGAGAGDGKRFSCVAELRARKVDAALKVFGLDFAAEVELAVQVLFGGKSATEIFVDLSEPLDVLLEARLGISATLLELGLHRLRSSNEFLQVVSLDLRGTDLLEKL